MFAGNQPAFASASQRLVTCSCALASALAKISCILFFKASFSSLVVTTSSMISEAFPIIDLKIPPNIITSYILLMVYI